MLIEEKEESNPTGAAVNHSHSIDRDKAEEVHKTHMMQNGITTNTNSLPGG